MFRKWEVANDGGFQMRKFRLWRMDDKAFVNYIEIHTKAGNLPWCGFVIQS